MRAFVAGVMLLASTGVPGMASAAPVKAVAYDIEPFELARTHELAELLARESATLRRALAATGLMVVDTHAEAVAIAAHQPLGECNACDLAIARTLGAEIVVTTTLQEIEYPVYNLFSTVRDAATGRILRKGVISIEGLDNEDWDRDVTRLVKERLLARPLPPDAAALREAVARIPVPPE